MVDGLVKNYLYFSKKTFNHSEVKTINILSYIVHSHNIQSEEYTVRIDIFLELYLSKAFNLNYRTEEVFKCYYY